MSPQMTSTERHAVLSLAAILSSRMLGLFMILPVFALYAQHLQGTTPTLVGVAIGVYGLSQALLQIPFGMFSDHWGRKPVITGGLLIFAAGSAVAALSTSISGVIMGRALQGAGAIASALMALTADLTREEHRTTAMALLGSSIGLSFLLALIIGPLLNHWIGVPGLFWFTAFLAITCIGILYGLVPKPLHSHFHHDTEPSLAQFKNVLAQTELLRPNVGVMLLHLQLSALFVVLPLTLSYSVKIDSAHHGYIYLPVMLLALVVMIPMIIFAEKYRYIKQMFIIAALMLSAAAGGFIFLSHSLVGVIGLLFLFFTAFIFLEASLPSLVSKIAPAASKGTALGVYSTMQFLGIFLGGTLGGWLHEHYGIKSVFLGCAVLSGAWILLTVTMPQPRYLSSFLLHIGEAADKQQAARITERLRQVQGVAEAVIIDGVAYLKIDASQVDWTTLDEFSLPS